MSKTAPFVLNLIGAIIALLMGIFAVVVGAAGAAAMPIFAFIGAMILGWGVWSIIVAIVLLWCSIKMNGAKDIKDFKKWNLIALIFSVLGLVTGVGFVIGTLLSLIGSIIGYTTKNLK